MPVAKKAVAKKVANAGGYRPPAKPAAKPAAKKIVGVYPKGPGVAGYGSPVSKSAKDNRTSYLDVIQTLRETSETRKDVYDTVSMMAAAGRKYKQDATKDIASWKKFVKKVTPEASDKRFR